MYDPEDDRDEYRREDARERNPYDHEHWKRGMDYEDETVDPEDCEICAELEAEQDRQDLYHEFATTRGL